ncbi:hypothetical protein GWK47_020503 [Chionoecetes opilio]|uniref:Uncharacterized protein n=1 Tax=Chionoecetes opilio TaxID=41210 RepID=A0A8J4XR13_CHIOP|nr:hypothetical protein GWK47_020503 [Chionoecetes opilio]
MITSVGWWTFPCSSCSNSTATSRFHMRDAKWEWFLSSSEDLLPKSSTPYLLTLKQTALCYHPSSSPPFSLPVSKPHAASIRTVGSTVLGLRNSTTVLMPLANSSVATLPPSTPATPKALFAMHSSQDPPPQPCSPSMVPGYLFPHTPRMYVETRSGHILLWSSSAAHSSCSN